MEKALLFPNLSSFSRQTPSPYVSDFRGFSLNHLGGGRGIGMEFEFKLLFKVGSLIKWHWKTLGKYYHIHSKMSSLMIIFLYGDGVSLHSMVVVCYILYN